MSNKQIDLKARHGQLIFDTPTRKGWLVIIELVKLIQDREYLVCLTAEKDLEYISSHYLNIKELFSTEDRARHFAQGVYFAIECV